MRWVALARSSLCVAAFEASTISRPGFSGGTRIRRAPPARQAAVRDRALAIVECALERPRRR